MSEAAKNKITKDKTDAAINRVRDAVSGGLKDWLATQPTGGYKITIEANASQGGLGQIYFEAGHRRRV